VEKIRTWINGKSSWNYHGKLLTWINGSRLVDVMVKFMEFNGKTDASSRRSVQAQGSKMSVVSGLNCFYYSLGGH
jgi:hypothetical protein